MALVQVFLPGSPVFSHNVIRMGFNESTAFLFFRITVQSKSNSAIAFTNADIHVEYPIMFGSIGGTRFDIREIVKGLFDIPFPAYDLDDDYPQQYHNIQVIAETIDADGAIVNSLTTGVIKCFWGGINFQKYRISHFFSHYMPIVKKLFTWQPNNQKVDFELKTYATFIFLTDQAGKAPKLVVKMYFDDATTQTITPIATITGPLIPTIVPTGFNALGLHDYETGGKLITKYDVFIGHPIINYAYDINATSYGVSFDVELEIDTVPTTIATGVTLANIDALVATINAYFTAEGIDAFATHSIGTGINIASYDGHAYGDINLISGVSTNYPATETVTGTISENTLTEIRTYFVNRQYYKQKKRFVWLNSLGGFDAILLTGVYINEFEYTGDEAIIFVPYNYDARDGERQPVDHTEQGIFTVASGWKTKAEIDHLRDALLTLLLAEDDGIQFIPIKIDRGTIRTLQSDQKLFGLQFKYHQLFKNPVYTSEEYDPTLDAGGLAIDIGDTTGDGDPA